MEDKQTDKPTSTGLRNRRLTIGYLPVSIGSLGQPMLAGMVDVARERDVNLICFPGGSLLDPAGYWAQHNIVYELANAENVDGVVSWASQIGTYLTVDEIRALHDRYRPLPVVTIGRTVEGFPGVLIDNHGGMREAVSHLIEVHGCRRLAFIRGPESHLYAQERYRAYTETLEAHGLPVDSNLITPPSSWGPATGREAMHLLLDERGLRPHTDLQAIVSVSEDTLFGALEVLLARGIQVPGDVAVVGFDDTILSQTNLPPVTTVASSFYETGRQAAKTVLALMQGEQVPGETIVPSKLVVRQSCGCLDPAVTQAAVDPVKVRGKTSESVLASRRDQVLSAMAQAVGESSRNVVVGWEKRLWDGFVGELKGKSPGLFLRRLDEVLRQAVAASGDVSAWQGAVLALRRQTLPYLDGEALRRAENLWQQARVMIGETSRRAQAYQQLQIDRRTEILREIEVALVTTFDLAGLMDVLAQSLPRLGIPSCYLSLYEDPQPYQYPQPRPSGPGWCWPTTGRDAPSWSLPGWRFRSNQLVPEEMWPQERSFRFIVEPLYFQEHQLGLVLFEVGPREVDVYEALRVQISSALQGALLTQERERAKAALEKAYAEVEKQVEERTAELQQEIVERKRAEEEIQRLNAELEQRVVERTAQLEAANKEIGSVLVLGLARPARAAAGDGWLFAHLAGRLCAPAPIRSGTLPADHFREYAANGSPD